jgi:ABC-2 type transport system permease protein
MVNVAFALAEAFARGFDTFPALVKSGELDRLFLRPRSLALQVAAQEVQLMRVGRLVQGAIVLAMGARALGVDWTAGRVLLLGASIAGGACTFAGLFVLQATMSFWTVETLEVLNAVTYGGTETAQFPISIYRPWFRAFFTWVVPLACANYFPAHAILGRPDELGSALAFQCASPLVGVVFLGATLLAFRAGARRYRSTGS